MSRLTAWLRDVTAAAADRALDQHEASCPNCRPLAETSRVEYGIDFGTGISIIGGGEAAAIEAATYYVSGHPVRRFVTEGPWQPLDGRRG